MEDWSFLMPESWPIYVKIALGTITVIVILSLLSLLSKPHNINTDLKELVITAAQMYEFSKQDSDPAVSLQHSTMALAYLSVARRLASDASIQQATKIIPSDLEKIFREQQAQNISVLSHKEPTLSSLVAGYATL
jgi:hypothetical protein